MFKQTPLMPWMRSEQFHRCSPNIVYQSTCGGITQWPHAAAAAATAKIAELFAIYRDNLSIR